MSMQSLLVSNNYASLKEALFCDGTYAPPLARALGQFCDAVVASRVALLRELRELPELRRGVPSQQYPQFGLAWTYIKRKHVHDRKDKRSKHPYPRPLDCGDGLEVWSAAGKRFAKRINNKRRRAEDRREIAWEMDLWVQDDEYKIVREESWVYSVAHGNTNLLAQDYGACNVYVQPHPECFAGHVTYGNVSIRVAQGLNTGNPVTMTPVQLCSEFPNER